MWAAQIGPATCSPTGTNGNQWAWEDLSFPRYPHLSASSMAPIGQTVSSNESWGVCQALETEWGKCMVCQGPRPAYPRKTEDAARAL